MDVSGPYPSKVDVKLLGTKGVTLRIVLTPSSYGQAKLERVEIEACYETGTFRLAVQASILCEKRLPADFTTCMINDY